MLVLGPATDPRTDIPRDRSLEIDKELDKAVVALRTGRRPSSALRRLCAALDYHRRSRSVSEWRTFCGVALRDHPVLALIHESSFSCRTFQRPRDYAGHVATLDYIYGTVSLPPATSKVGNAVCRWELRCNAARAVRARRDVLAAALDSVAERRPGARVLSVGSGGLEVQASRAARGASLGTLIAFDGSLQQITTGDRRWSDLDFIYSVGLYDCLATPFATALTRALFGMLRAGGRLVLASLAPELGDIAYFEAMSDWWMARRSEAVLRSLAATIPAEAIARTKTYRAAAGNVVVLELVRGS